MLTRRQFFQSLAASVVAAGMPLPVGFPREAKADDGITYFGMFDHLAKKDYARAHWLVPTLEQQSKDWHNEVRQTILDAMQQHGHM